MIANEICFEEKKKQRYTWAFTTRVGLWSISESGSFSFLFDPLVESSFFSVVTTLSLSSVSFFDLPSSSVVVLVLVAFFSSDSYTNELVQYALVKVEKRLTYSFHGASFIGFFTFLFLITSFLFCSDWQYGCFDFFFFLFFLVHKCRWISKNWWWSIGSIIYTWHLDTVLDQNPFSSMLKALLWDLGSIQLDMSVKMLMTGKDSAETSTRIE